MRGANFGEGQKYGRPFRHIFYFLHKPLYIFHSLSHHKLQDNSQLDYEEVPVTG
jgi:hypothetical protein